MKITGEIKNLSKEQLTNLTNIAHELSDKEVNTLLEKNELSLYTLIYAFSLANLACINYVSALCSTDTTSLIKIINEYTLALNEDLINQKKKNDDSTIDHN